MAKIPWLPPLHARHWRAWWSAVLTQAMAWAVMGLGIFLFLHADKNPYAYVPALAMVGLPSVQGLRQCKATWLNWQMVRSIQRAERQEEMLRQMSIVRSWTGVPTSWTAPSRMKAP